MDFLEPNNSAQFLDTHNWPTRRTVSSSRSTRRAYRLPPLEPTLTREQLVTGLRVYFQGVCVSAEELEVRLIARVLMDLARALGLSASECEDILAEYARPER